MAKRDYSIFTDLMEKYAQDQNPQDQTDTEQVDPNVNPDAIQTGQTIYDTSGQEYIVLDPNESGQRNIMPSDQQGQQIPTGVKTVNPDELSASYTTTPMTAKVAQDFANSCTQAADHIDEAVRTLQPFAQSESHELNTTFEKGYIDPLNELSGFLKLERRVVERDAHRIAQELENADINWSDFKDIMNDMNSAITEQDAKRLLESAEDMVNLILLHISMPEDVKVAAPKMSKVLPQFKTAQSGELQSFHEPVRFDKAKDTEEGLAIGESGFTDCMTALKELVDGGYSSVDIVLTLGERFDRQLANKVLAEARSTGLL